MQTSNILSFTTGPPAAIPKEPEAHSRTTTSWIPMITSPPRNDDCSSHFYRDHPNQQYTAFEPRLEALANLTCLPDAAVLWYAQEKPRFGAFQATITSLGPIVCPNAYTTATSSVKDASSTLIFCCPTNYNYVHGIRTISNLTGCTSDYASPDPVRTVHSPDNPEPTRIGAPFNPMLINAVPVEGWIFNDTLVEDTIIRPYVPPAVEQWSLKHFRMPFAGTIATLLFAPAFMIFAIWLMAYLVGRRFYIFRTRRGFQLRRRPILALNRVDSGRTLTGRATSNIFRPGFGRQAPERREVPPAAPRQDPTRLEVPLAPARRISTVTTEATQDVELQNVSHRSTESKEDENPSSAGPRAIHPGEVVNNAQRSGTTPNESAITHTGPGTGRPEESSSLPGNTA